MTKKFFSKEEINELKKNPNILEVKKNAITYLPEFKLKVVLEAQTGKSPTEIFVKNDFNLDIIGKDIPRKRLYNWRQIYNKSGELGLMTENRGKASTKPSSRVLSVEDQLKRAEAKIKFLEAENDFLKKLEELERQAMKKNHY